MQKINEERKECEEKEKKRKEVRGDQHIKVKLEGIVEDYKTLLFSNFQKKRICFVRVMSF